MNLANVRGYKKLTPFWRQVFKEVFRRHQAVLGTEAKTKFAPVSVKQEKGYLRVTVKNGGWFHYTANGSWY